MTRILLATSNGTGLGHLTRAMAIARRLPGDVSPIILTLSQAAPVATREGFYSEFLCSYEYSTMDPNVWHLHYARRLEHVVELYEPDLVMFDGVYPYVGLVRAVERLPDVPFIWCRRAMWKPQTGVHHLRDSGLFHRVLEPGEYAAEADRGPTSRRRGEAHRVAPIVYLDRDELLDRRAAAEGIGLDPDRPAVLVQLGSGSVRSIETAAGQVVARLLGVHGLQVTVAESVIAGSSLDLPESVHRARVYPLARYSAAFDFAVAASGYNLFHEALAYAIPALFVPKQDATRDDQAGRAHWAAQQGLGLVWDSSDPANLDHLVHRLLDNEERADMRGRMGALPPATGAREAAEWLAGLTHHAHGQGD